MKRRIGFAALFVLWSAPWAFAQEQTGRPDCEAAQTTAEITECANADFERADADLNATYKNVLAATERADKQFAAISSNEVGAVDAIRKAQRAWLAYRDASCEVAGFEARGGTLENVLYIGCTADLTRKRTQELRALLQAEWLQ